MRTHSLSIVVALLATSSAPAEEFESIDGRVVQITMPDEDVVLYYLETKGGMAVELRSKTASVIGTKFFVGDGKIAVPLVVKHPEGIVFQGGTKLSQGFVFEKDAVVELQPGHTRASKLSPGDVYVTLPVYFQSKR